jgi:hypothetical protein
MQNGRRLGSNTWKIGEDIHIICWLKGGKLILVRTIAAIIRCAYDMHNVRQYHKQLLFCFVLTAYCYKAPKPLIHAITNLVHVVTKEFSIVHK